MKWLALSLILVFLIAGCTQSNDDNRDAEISSTNKAMMDECISLCNQYTGDKSNGMCIGNPMSNNDWVCDIAHSPREAVDNLPENQCSAFSNTATHFVEVDKNCNFIKSY
jgi:nitrous oxide reductase accessory protein NosL